MAGVLNVVTSLTANEGFTATASPLTTSATGIAPGTVQTLEAILCSPVNGAPPYTYAWTYVSGDTAITAKQPTDSVTRFQAYFAVAGFYSAVYKCTVTDNDAVVIDSNTVTITLEAF